MKNWKTSVLIAVIILLASYIALPEQFSLNFQLAGVKVNQPVNLPQPDFYFLGRRINPAFELKQGLDIRGGTRVDVKVDMNDVPQEERAAVLKEVRDIIAGRVDLYGLSELQIQTAVEGDVYKISVEIPAGVDQDQVIQLVSQTAQVDFRLQVEDPDPAATQSTAAFISNFETTDIDGRDISSAQVSISPQIQEPVIALEFTPQGARKLTQVTQESQGRSLAVFIDGFPVAIPRIEDPILAGRATISGGFTLDGAQRLAAQLNAGALPASLQILEQRSLEPGLGRLAIQQSLQAGFIGLCLVSLFMILYYGFKGFAASLILVTAVIFNLAVYKIFGVILTLPGIAGLILTIGMAVDANIIIFERMKDEIRSKEAVDTALELSFKKALDSIWDANILIILTALVLINPLDFSFLNTSGMVRTFGTTLLIGVLVGLFTGVFVSRNFFGLVIPLYEGLAEKEEK